VVDKGELDCTKIFKVNEEAKYLKTYKPGESFGELSLLYNAKRAATIKAKTDSIAFALDRDTFNNIVKDSAVKKRDRFESILNKIELLKSMDAYERVSMGDGAKELKVKAGDMVIKQGDEGDKIYMIAEGELDVFKVENQGS
jgi:cAMP-dependent protein kinase regulator